MGMRRWSVLAALLILGALIWAGCGSSSDENSDDASAGGSRSSLVFYDWSENVLGPARVVDPFVPGSDPDEVSRALGDLRKRWNASGRPPAEGDNRSRILMGAEPSRKAAEHVATSERKTSNDSEGVIVISEQTVDPRGKPIPGPANRGFFAINDSPALTGLEIKNATASKSLDGEPIVTFEFTRKGHTAFQALTRRIAKRGRERALTCGKACPAVLLSDSFVMVFDKHVLERKTVNFIEYPDGLDGNTGFQINGGFTPEEAESLATALEQTSR